MTFGTARNAAEVPAYLSSVRGGREVPEEVVEEFVRRFARVGGSPLIELTERQAAALEAVLNATARPGSEYLVRAGMRHSHPTIQEALAELGGAGARTVVGIIMSPQYSPRIMGGYLAAFEQAKAALDLAMTGVVAEDWHQSPALIEGLADQLRAALAETSETEPPVIFTAHSLPRSVADNEPNYLAALRETAAAVATRLGIAADQWQFAYQSAGHTREEWLKPDLVDLFPSLRAQRHSTVVVTPVQFLTDHLEVLYDLDVAAREQAATVGLALIRTPSLNAAPLLIEALASTVHDQLAGL